MIRRYIIWRNEDAAEEKPCEIANKEALSEAALRRSLLSTSRSFPRATWRAVVRTILLPCSRGSMVPGARPPSPIGCER